jgi:putative two-component system response regulator
MIPYIDLLNNPALVCVDDEAIILMSLEQEIREVLDSNVEIELFTSGEAALAFIEAHKAEGNDLVLVISDQVMPKMTGDAFLEKVHTLSPETKTVMLTGYSNIEALKNAVNAGGISRYFTKPWNHELLQSVLVESVTSYTLNRMSALHNRQIERITDSLINALEKTNAVFDYDLGEHVHRVSLTSGLLAKEAGFPESFVRRIVTFSKLHDVGKIGVACSLMNKKDIYSPEEYELMKMHVIFGGKVFENSEIDSMARNIALYHHEKWDGSGYKQGLSGEAIPIESRIVAIADVFDALVSQRPYKAALPFDEAVKIILDGRGKHFDPTLVDNFQSHLREIREISAYQD